ncbi:MAG: bifunctional phosphoribosyl-AMP cyclohydrolase/phosphoribosyl-ATP diphosphatase HisIE [Chitinophagaceae bacterium]|nr:bifunctional phosphoribosyl-AMP cyclohydrolase/phosphoribosyl-ATP diphosphatase HisIE [Chitinophagaceae bacterium]
MNIDYGKYADGLVPAIVQDSRTGQALMLGFMNEQALQETKRSGHVTFFSRTKERLWTKGEESGHYLELVSIDADCDNDTLLIKARPHGPVCHTGTDTCFGATNTGFGFVYQLEAIIRQRQEQAEAGSYVSNLMKKGINAVAQKVGEEAVEMVIESKDNDRKKFLDEAADLLFHYLILLKAKGHSLAEVENVLEGRHKEK